METERRKMQPDPEQRGRDKVRALERPRARVLKEPGSEHALLALLSLLHPRLGPQRGQKLNQ